MLFEIDRRKILEYYEIKMMRHSKIHSYIGKNNKSDCQICYKTCPYKTFTIRVLYKTRNDTP